MSTLSVETNLRAAPMPELIDLLRRQADVKYDAVVPASRLRYEGGLLHLAGGALRWDDDGATEVDRVLHPTAIFDGTLADKLGIPVAYLRHLRASGIEAPVEWRTSDDDLVGASSHPLLDLNVNAWLQSLGDKRFLVRAFATDDPDELGIARSFLGETFRLDMDNYDVLLAALAGVKEAGLDLTELEIDGDVNERNMRVRVVAPQVTAMAPKLLENYRSPFGGGIERIREVARGEGMGYEPGTEPVVEAGFTISNSETGGGACVLQRRLRVRICRNGLTIGDGAFRGIHVGQRLEEGVVDWSSDTQRKAVELITARTRDVVASFLDPAYLGDLVARIEEKAATPVTEPVKVIERVVKAHAFSEAEAESILACFTASGQLTAGGVMQAVTATAQRIEDPDRAAELEELALPVLATAAA